MSLLFKNKSFVLLFQGALVSAIGTTLYGFAGGLYVQTLFPKEIYGNAGAFYLSIVAAAPILATLIVSPLAGALVDKWNKVRIIYMTDFIRGAIFFVSLYMLRGGLTNYEIVTLFTIVGAIAGINAAFFRPAVTSVIPDIVGDDLIQAAQGAQSIVGSVQGILGVVAGMILYELIGIEVAILANAISFLISGLSEMFIRTKYDHPIVKSEEKHIFGDIKLGFKYMLTKEGLLTMMVFSLFLNFAFTPLFSVGIPYLFKTELGQDGFQLGYTNIAFSIAMLVGGVSVGSMKLKSLSSTVRKGITYLSSSFLLTTLVIYLVSYGFISYSLFYILFIVLMVALAIFMSITNIPLNTAMLKAIEPQYRGRVFSIIGALATGAIPLSMILGGLLIQYTNVAILGITCTVIMLFPTYGFLFNGSVRKLFTSFEEAEIDGRLQEAV